MKPPSQQAKAVAVLLAAAMAVSALVLNSMTWSKMRSSIVSVQRALETKAEWEKLLSMIKDADVSQRGFLLSGEPKQLEAVDTAKASMSACFVRLAELDSADKVLKKEMQDLRQMIRARNNLAAESIVVRKREGLQAAIQLESSGEGQHLMDGIREKITSLIEQQQHLADRQTKIMNHDLRKGYLSSIASGVIALIAGGVALFLVREAATQARREEGLAVEKRRAEESNRQKSSFLATMSHEIRTPMNAILGFSELLEAEAATDKQKRYTQAIVAGGRSLLQLINDILDLSKIEAGMLQIHHEPTDVRDVGWFAVQLFSQQAVQKQVELRLEVQDSLPHSLLIDHVRLRQVLINVAGNALKFTDHGHVLIRFSSETPPDHRSRLTLRMEVEDTGTGIPADRQKEIFEPFVQGGGHGTSDRRGTGLGLSIVRRLVDLMQGSISLDSQEGAGSTFCFDFPGVEVSARLPSAQADGEPRIDFNDLRPSLLLVADDNATNRDLLLGMFEKTHHRIHLVADGAEAVQAVLDQRPDIVLMDLRMPVMDGREALRAIRARPEYNLLPIIAVTASSTAMGDQELCRTFDGHVRKPFSSATLYRELSHFIPRHNAPLSPTAAASSEDPLSPDEAARWRDLAVRLRDLERETWPGLCEGMLMSDLKLFAANLLEMALAVPCPQLEAYARQLCDDVEAFAIMSLEQYLAEFPQQITDIERRSAPFPA